MRTLAQSCPNIEELNLSQCKRISDATCAALSSHCPKLQRLNLDSCPEITDMSLKDLAAGCPLLTHINLSWCELLTDNGVDALAKGCPELRSFLSKGCRQLTDKAVMCLARYCPNLEAINLHECRVLISLTLQIRMLRTIASRASDSRRATDFVVNEISLFLVKIRSARITERKLTFVFFHTEKVEKEITHNNIYNLIQ